MITVNLRPDLKRKRAARNPLQGLTEGFRGLGAKVKDPLPLMVMGSWVGVIGFFGFVMVSTSTQLSQLEPKLEQTRAENKRFRAFLTEKRHQEMIRDSLVAQIGVIRSVDGDRYVWSHVLDEVTKALPAYTWLTDMGADGVTNRPRNTAPPAAPNTPAGKRAKAAADSAAAAAAASRGKVPFTINGRTVDIQAYTKFLRQLEASPWITDVTPVSAQTVVEKERPITAFSIKATFRDADSAYIRTVPLSQSVR
ncbi:MAG TPA: PilN domain-containing protein [Gemmatimonadales bacterium]|nr:PilN domain-containing protein [Gemmatimonadales bacterium]